MQTEQITESQLLILRNRWKRLYDKMQQLYPAQYTLLNYRTPWELLVAVILSAQTTDAQVNKVTPVLFKQYPTVQSLADAPYYEVCSIVSSLGFYRVKAKYIQETARQILTQFAGDVPVTLPELVTLSGVGRKTANVVIGNLAGKFYGFVAESIGGIAVDTHVIRFANRFGFCTTRNPVLIEQILNQIIPQSQWVSGAYYIKQYGRTHGKADGRGYRQDMDPIYQIYLTNI